MASDDPDCGMQWRGSLARCVSPASRPSTWNAMTPRRNLQRLRPPDGRFNAACPVVGALLLIGTVVVLVWAGVSPVAPTIVLGIASRRRRRSHIIYRPPAPPKSCAQLRPE